MLIKLHDSSDASFAIPGDEFQEMALPFSSLRQEGGERLQEGAGPLTPAFLIIPHL